MTLSFSPNVQHDTRLRRSGVQDTSRGQLLRSRQGHNIDKRIYQRITA